MAARTAPFRWQDGERVIVFGRDRLSEAPQLLDPGYVVLSTPRAASSAPAVLEHAETMLEVAPGLGDELAAGRRSGVHGELLVAVGGGRVIDVAKALAAADPLRRVAAIPTTLSGAEMTPVHRHATGVAPETPRVRPAIVINDPRLSASQPPPALARSAANALGHALEGPLTPLANPVASLAAVRATQLIHDAVAADLEPAADEALALAALLAGYVIGATGYGLHHVVSQTLARFAGVAHGDANAIMLPQSLFALGRRFPAELHEVAEAVGSDPVALASRLCEIGGVTRLRDAGVSRDQLDHCVQEASARPELQMTPPAAGRDELAELYAAAY